VTPQRPCPRYGKPCTCLRRHLSRCHPHLPSPGPLHSLLVGNTGGAPETVEHVLFHCPTLRALRPALLQDWATCTLPHRRLALAHLATSAFVRAALAQLHDREAPTSFPASQFHPRSSSIPVPVPSPFHVIERYKY